MADPEPGPWCRHPDGTRTGCLETTMRDGQIVVTRADPQVVFSESWLEAVKLGYPVRVIPPDWRRIRLAAEADADLPVFHVVGEPGRLPMDVRVDEWTGAVLRIDDRANGRVVVYRISRYLGDRMWLGVWPD